MAEGSGSLRCSIVTPERRLFEAEATKVVVAGHDDGEIGFLPGHAAYLGTLGYGRVRIETTDGGGVRTFGVYGGFVQVDHNQVTVLANEAEEPGDVTEESIAEDRAKLAATETKSDQGFADHQRLSRRIRIREKLRAP